MITETIFLFLLASMFAFLILTLHYKNEAFCAFTIILTLLVAMQLLPGIGGISYQDGANITDVNSTTTVQNTYSSFTNTPLATLFFIIVIYLTMQILTFRKSRKEQRLEDGEE